MYKYLGENFPYNGVIYHKPQGGNEIAVGKWINGIINIDSYNSKTPNNEIIKVKDQSSGNLHRTKREISLSLRFAVLKRDNFKCCICGSSPAKDTSIELHIDHIIPWSKGGESVIENLQTLCSSCNIGKRDSI